jgi:hypothetical protein
VHWLYYQRFPDTSKGDDEELEKAWRSSDNAYTLTTNLIKMYVFGNQNIIPKLQRDALDAVFHHIVSTPSDILPDDKQVRCAFDYLDVEDPICRFLVDANIYYDYCSSDHQNPYNDDERFDWSTAYLRAFARQTTRLVGGMRCEGRNIGDFEPKLCDYHEHRTDEDRKTCEKSQPEYEE